MKAILVAGGHGSRLYPFTRYTHKTLLPLHRRPVIDYALATIRRAGISDITIIGKIAPEFLLLALSSNRDVGKL